MIIMEKRTQSEELNKIMDFLAQAQDGVFTVNPALKKIDIPDVATADQDYSCVDDESIILLGYTSQY